MVLIYMVLFLTGVDIVLNTITFENINKKIKFLENENKKINNKLKKVVLKDGKNK